MSGPMPKPGPFLSRHLAVEEVSAGGIVVDFTRRDLPVALIARLNRAGKVEWCLPKGHLEGVETPAETARREVFEETGIDGSVLSPLGSVEYTFSVSGRRIHKVVHHFLLKAVGGSLTIENDPDHEAIDAGWVPFNQLLGRLSFANERRMVQSAALRLPRSAE